MIRSWFDMNQTVTINRPRALNALSTPLFSELNDALRKFDADDSTGVVVLTGNEKVFAGEYVVYVKDPCYPF